MVRSPRRLRILRLTYEGYKSTRVEESTANLEEKLSNLYDRVSTKNNVPMKELGSALRRAAASLSSNDCPQPSIIHYMVALPFRIFSKQSIQLGISLWLGVIHDNPRTEPRILVEVMSCWERTVEQKKGLFNPSFE